MKSLSLCFVLILFFSNSNGFKMDIQFETEITTHSEPETTTTPDHGFDIYSCDIFDNPSVTGETISVNCYTSSGNLLLCQWTHSGNICESFGPADQEGYVCPENDRITAYHNYDYCSITIEKSKESDSGSWTFGAYATGTDGLPAYESKTFEIQ